MKLFPAGKDSLQAKSQDWKHTIYHGVNKHIFFYILVTKLTVNSICAVQVFAVHGMTIQYSYIFTESLVQGYSVG